MSNITLAAGTRPIDVAALPQDWRAKQLKDFCTFVQGGRLGLTKQGYYQSSGVPAFSAAGQDGYVEATEFRDTDAVVLSAIGANCGRCFVAAGDWTTLANVQVVIPDSMEAHARFLHYRVNRDDYWPRSGSAQPFIKPSDIKACWIALPPLVQQVATVRVLDTLDTAIHETEAIIAKLKAVKQGLLHDLLTRGIAANGELRPPQTEAPHLYKPSPLGWVPQDWDFAPLVSKIDFPEGQVDPRKAPYRDWVLVAPDHIESGTGRLLSTATAADQQAISGKYVFQAGDVIYSKIRPYLRKAVLASSSGLCSADMYPLRPKPEIDPRYLLAVVLGDQFSRFAESVSMRSGFPKINRSEMSEFSMGWPRPEEQAWIARLLNESDSKQRFEEDELEKLKLLKVGLMDDLLTGRVRVTPLLADAAQQQGSA